MAFKPKCMLLGDGETMAPMVSALADTRASVCVLEELPDHILAAEDAPDYVFISTDLGLFNINRAISAIKAKTEGVRIVLIDPHGDFPYRAREFGAHGLFTLGDGAERIAAQYWTGANLSVRLL